MANGLGGYSGTSIIGALGRTHQGYLIASLHPPVERYVVFSKTAETLSQDGKTYHLEAAQHAGAPISAASPVSSSDVPDAYKAENSVSVASDFTLRRPVYTEGQRYLESFDYDGTVSFCYRAGALSMTKRIALVHGRNLCAVAYDIRNSGDDAVLTVTPHMNFREHSASATPESLRFATSVSDHAFTLVPEASKDVSIRLSYSAGELVPRTSLYDQDVQLQTEVELETPGLDTHYTPYDLVVSVPAKATMQLSILCEVLTEESLTSPVLPGTAAGIVADEKNRLLELIAQSGRKDPFAQALTVASSEFLCHRQSTGLTTVLAGLPWFTDWGRDTMIAFSGLTLSTRRFAEAREILLTFARYVHNGLVPNMFPDDGQPPLYNTADASLWYFYAVQQYLKYTGADSDYEFIRTEIYPALKEIIDAYRNGTDFSIHMDRDGLIHAGSGTDQVTWMDVRVGDWVVTPRHGKPVEINALWYNALKVMEELSQHFCEESFDYGQLAETVRLSFNAKFWNDMSGCLFDVVDGDEVDYSIRPNQIYAVSLPYTMLSKEHAKAVVNVVYEKLYAGTGLRSLAPEDPEYHPVYCGSLPKRDAAYHQGTSWGYLLGGFITAFRKVNGDSKETAEKANALLDPIRAHLWDGCIGSISEIFDGDAPHNCRGCYAQAWSVGEVLRCYTEDILPLL